MAFLAIAKNQVTQTRPAIGAIIRTAKHEPKKSKSRKKMTYRAQEDSTVRIAKFLENLRAILKDCKKGKIII